MTGRFRFWKLQQVLKLCSKVIQPASLIVVFQTLLSSAATTVDEEKGNPSWQAQADFYVIWILSSLPWGGAELAEDFVEDLWDRTQSLASNGWKLDSVIMDLCKALPGAFPAVVAGAVRALFEKISDLDMDSRTRLILWFSHHLSNFQFIWPWEEWAYVLDLPKWAPKRVFVQEVLQREVRLSHWDKIKQHNASGLEELLPAKVGRAYMYSLEEGKEKTEEHELSAELNRKVKEKQYARDMMSWIEETIYPVHGFEVTLTVVAQTLLDIGSKIFTHLVTVLERYGQVFAKLCPDNDKQAIVRWVFSPENVDQFHVSDQPWEILGNALNKTYNRISDLRKEISSIKKNVLVAEKASANARVELEAAESKLLLVEGEPVLGDDPLKMKRLRTTVEKTGEAELSLRESLEVKEALLNRLSLKPRFYCSRCFRVSLQSSRSGSQNQQKQDHCRI
ncbi:hypothetical protein Bca52824_060550 [Brassica carinata]|uniref:ABH1 n=1 Tax=Brassica carinata TaxID=52824 RepID=A0A8X7UFQ2_BRACI|nr:hypothetical protein Bca52824_060550 [Brassica carinata]